MSECSNLIKLIKNHSSGSERGPKGPKGDPGSKGDPGTSISVTDEDEPDDFPDGTVNGDLIIDKNGQVYQWDEEDDEGEWKETEINLTGPQGPQGSVEGLLFNLNEPNPPCEDMSQITINPDDDNTSINVYPTSEGWLARIPAEENVKNCRGSQSVDFQGLTLVKYDIFNVDKFRQPHPNYQIFPIIESSPESISGGDFSGILSGIENYIGQGGHGSVISGGGLNRIGRIDDPDDPQMILFDEDAPQFASIHGGWYNTIASDGDKIPYTSSIIGGYFNRILGGDNATVIGGHHNTSLERDSSIVGGFNNIASARYSSVIGGQVNEASGGQSSTIAGQNNKTSDLNSVTIGGRYLETTGRDSVVMGRFNGGDMKDTTDDNRDQIMFSIGNGINLINKSDIFRVYDNGDLEISGKLTENAGSGGPDYAEEFYVSDVNNVPTVGDLVWIDKTGRVTNDIIEIDGISHPVGIVSNTYSYLCKVDGLNNNPNKPGTKIYNDEEEIKVNVGILGRVYMKKKYADPKYKTLMPSKWRVLTEFMGHEHVPDYVLVMMY